MKRLGFGGQVSFDRQLLVIDRTLSQLDENLNFKPTLVSTKTERSEREIVLTQEALDVLLRHKTAQLQERAHQSRWKDHQLIFPSTLGTPMNESNFIHRHYRPIVERAGLRYIRPHDHRHTHITLARDAGVDLEIVAHRAGQDPRVTARIYSKVTLKRQRKGAKTLSELTQHTVDNTEGGK